MLYAIITTANSRADVQDAIDWENSREAGLANRFLNDLEQKLSAISRTPHMGAVRYENVRCVTTKVFSYLIHYTLDDTLHEIYILRILHTSRKPIW